jgi:hypothetical protein
MLGAARRRQVRAAVALVLAGGLVLAGLVAPAVVGLGLSLKAVSDHFEAFPTKLPAGALAQRSVVLDASGGTVAVLHGPEDRVVVSLTQISPLLKQAVVAVEDARFYLHHGIDVHSLIRAVVHNGRGGSQQGASTLTEQYVKLSLLEAARTPAERAAATSRSSYQRKLREARIALALERRETKAQILAGYLNIAYFGEGAYGIATAAQHYFGVPSNRLTLPQAALLAGIVNSPVLFDPVNHPAAAVERRSSSAPTSVPWVFAREPQVSSRTRASPRLPLSTAIGSVPSFVPTRRWARPRPNAITRCSPAASPSRPVWTPSCRPPPKGPWTQSSPGPNTPPRSWSSFSQERARCWLWQPTARMARTVLATPAWGTWATARSFKAGVLSRPSRCWLHSKRGCPCQPASTPRRVCAPTLPCGMSRPPRAAPAPAGTKTATRQKPPATTRSAVRGNQ